MANAVDPRPVALDHNFPELILKTVSRFMPEVRFHWVRDLDPTFPDLSRVQGKRAREMADRLDPSAGYDDYKAMFGRPLNARRRLPDSDRDGSDDDCSCGRRSRSSTTAAATTPRPWSSGSDPGGSCASNLELEGWFPQPSTSRRVVFAQAGPPAPVDERIVVVPTPLGARAHDVANGELVWAYADLP